VSASGPSAVIILAAGEGTRMKSRTPKVLHEVCGTPMLGHVLAAAAELDPRRIIVVVGHGRDQVTSYLAARAPRATAVVQDHQGGTGHAVRTAVEATGVIPGTVIVTYADTPLLRGRTLAELAAARQTHRAAAAILTARLADPAGYGRILRTPPGVFAGIVEEPDATPEQRAITEINSGMYAFDGEHLADVIKRLPTSNAKGEEYLTDAVGLLADEGQPVVCVQAENADEILGVNDLAQLARARGVLNAALLRRWMRAGAEIIDPASTWIDTTVVLEPGAAVAAGTQLRGRTSVAAGATVGPNCLLRDTVVGPGATVLHSVCESAVIPAGARIGPFAHLAGTAGDEGERAQ
jgi:bifunctional UDP-N-acetylglucosamine pyrophosphorylase/glucosamine-1-phosphate N-acetyltransferase